MIVVPKRIHNLSMNPEKLQVPRAAMSEREESDVRTYRRWRDRRREAYLQRPNSQPRLSTDMEDMLRFARIWAPFGGVPEYETFVRFGISIDKLVDRLSRILDDYSRNSASS